MEKEITLMAAELTADYLETGVLVVADVAQNEVTVQAPVDGHQVAQVGHIHFVSAQFVNSKRIPADVASATSDLTVLLLCLNQVFTGIVLLRRQWTCFL